jgi:hypothetical protein
MFNSQDIHHAQVDAVARCKRGDWLCESIAGGQSADGLGRLFDTLPQ